MFIDIHAHAYKYQYPNENGEYMFPTPAEVMNIQNELDIEISVLLPVLGPEIYVPQSVGEVIDMANSSNGRFAAFCNIDPRVLTNCSDAPLGKLIEHYKKLGCLGIGEVMPNIPWEDKRMQNLLRFAEMADMPIIFDMTGRREFSYGIYDKPGMPGLRYCLEKYPSLKFIGHGTSFWAELAELRNPGDILINPAYRILSEGYTVKFLREYPNLYAELSAECGYNALARDETYAPKFLTEFSDKLMFGTDISIVSQRFGTADILKGLRDNGKITAEIFEKIARGNAKRILKI